MTAKKWFRFIKIISIIIVSFYCTIVAYLYFSQESIIYHPSGIPVTPKEVEVVRPGGDQRPYGWYVAPESSDKAVFIHFHGNSGNLSSRYKNMRPYIDEGYGVLMVEYAGYGGNPGRPSEEQFYKDAELFFEYLESKVANENIVIYGESLGSGPATYTAKKYNARALILEVPYDSLISLARDRYPFLIGIEYLLRDHFDNGAKIPFIDMPVLIMLAGNDEVIPIEYGKNLYDKAIEPKTLKIYEGIGHNEVPSQNPYPLIIDFIETLKSDRD